MKHCKYCNDIGLVPAGFYCGQVDKNSTILEPCRNCNTKYSEQLPKYEIHLNENIHNK
jgi:hypothetical protein